MVFINTIPIWGGGERWTLETALELSRRGHRVRALAASRGVLQGKLRDAALHTDLVPDSLLARVQFLGRLRRKLRQDSPDLVVAATGRDLRLARLLRGAGSATRVVLARQLDRPLAGGLLRRMSFGRVDLVIANSDATRDSMARSLPWIPVDRILRIYNPFDAENFRQYSPREVRIEQRIEREAFVIGCVARLSEQKAHRILFRAMVQVRRVLPDAILLIVGDGELAEPLREHVRLLGISEACRFVGHANSVQPYYAACDAVAIPSHYEGFCFSAVEAQAMEKPVVASRVSSLPEVVADQQSAFLVPVGDSVALAERIIQLGREPELRRQMGRAGRKFVEKFSPPSIYAQLERSFEGMRQAGPAKG